MKPYVIVGILILATFTIFVWYVRITRDKKKTADRPPDEQTLFV